MFYGWLGLRGSLCMYYVYLTYVLLPHRVEPGGSTARFTSRVRVLSTQPPPPGITCETKLINFILLFPPPPAATYLSTAALETLLDRQGEIHFRTALH